MGHFYFHVRSGDHVIPDDQGRDLPDVSAARREAILSARELWAEAIRHGLFRRTLPFDERLLEPCANAP